MNQEQNCKKLECCGCFVEVPSILCAWKARSASYYTYHPCRALGPLFTHLLERSL